MSEDKQIGITSQGYEIWDNGKGFQWTICRKHNWAFVESYGCSGFNVDEACIGCLVEERIIKLLDECVCGASVEKCMTCECNERKIKRVDLIALIKGEK